MRLKAAVLISIFSFVMLFACSADDTSTADPVPPPSEDGSPNEDKNTKHEIDEFVANNNFESDIDFTVSGDGKWTVLGFWAPNRALFTQESDGGVDNTKCVKISSSSDTDVALVQVVSNLKPYTNYKASVMFKTQNITTGQGAVVFNKEKDIRSQGLKGTTRWTEQEVTFLSSGNGTATIGFRFGWNGGASRGSVYVDNFRLQIDPNWKTVESKHMLLSIKSNEQILSVDGVMDWLKNLDIAYKSMCEFVGENHIPFYGDKIEIRSVPGIPAWAFAGNPIQWNSKSMVETLPQIIYKEDWSFGMLHEMGHDFGPKLEYNANQQWDWNDEFFCNNRMAYVLDRVAECKVFQNGKFYTGENIIDYYYDFYKMVCIDKTPGEEHRWSDALQYTFLRFTKEVGWLCIAEAYRELYNMDPDILKGSSNAQKLDYILNIMSKYSKTDLKATYPAGELDYLKTII